MKKLLSLLILVFVLFIPSFVSAEEYLFDIKVSGNYDYDSAYEVLKLTNEHRAANGLPALTMDKTLLDYAMKRAAENAVVYSHTRPNGQAWHTLCASSSKVRFENIAYGYYNANSVFNGWKNSSGHNTAMLSSEIKSAGIGCFYQPGSGNRMWVQIFSTKTGDNYKTAGHKSVTNTIPVSSECISFIIYTPDMSYLAASRTQAATEICPGETAEYQLAAYNSTSLTAIDPSSYTLSSSDSTVKVKNYSVTGVSEGPFKILFTFSNGIGLYSKEFAVTHTYDLYSGNITKPPTCTEPGYSSAPCERCGHISAESLIPALGHYENTIPEVAPTCTEDGKSESIVCADCGEVLKPAVTIPKTGHNFITYEPDNALAGAVYKKCEYCGEENITDPYKMLNDEIMEIYLRGVKESDRERLEVLKTTYHALTPQLQERLTNYPLIEKMFAELDGIKGDVNSDGTINALDATQILRYANGKSNVITSSGTSKIGKLMYIADVNNDGTVNALDATQILRYANGKTSALK